MLTRIDGSGGMSFNSRVEYNPDKTVKQLRLESTFIFDFLYENDQITTIQLTVNGESRTYNFTYTLGGKIASYDDGEELVQLLYNPANNSYSFSTNDDYDITITLTQDGDIKQYELEDNFSNQGSGSAVVFYDDAKKGSMTNSNPINLHLGIIFKSPLAMQYLFPYSKKPIELMSTSQGVSLEYNNTYDSQGFIKSMTMLANGEEAGTSNFIYTSID
ncbi:hypothetical protein M0M57_08700 [Flavobacterium azooxidireducens]|uniref:DUF4595 domain-containing protein n=1 Tax=Flavobacterium azooxidireducens TaxID=1871076 RepID=A0ABY4KA96_9FLAO|nr:hypothetical protein [Flavobacterium azooxidireducens]UPQ77712.1 hypothetical protein M0M57_08700 [Flavobacterium azooxidireducens]